MSESLPSLQEVARRLNGEAHSNYVTFPTPGHGIRDRGSSFRYSDAATDGFDVASFNGYDKKTLKDYVRTSIGLAPFQPKGKSSDDVVVATYVYLDAEGQQSRKVTRTAAKKFWQHWWNGKEWIAKDVGKNCPILPYRLPEVIAANTVYIVEGEKDADRLYRLGFTATCNPMGAGKWRPEMNHWFKGKRVFVIPDQDEVGLPHAKTVVDNLASVADETHVVELPINPATGKPWKDPSDWLDADPDGAMVLSDIADASPATGAAKEDRKPEQPPEPRKPNPFPIIDIGAISDQPIADIEFTDYRRFWARGYCHNHLGDGGAGKTTLILQKAIAHTSGGRVNFMGGPAQQGAFIFFSAEERVQRMRWLMSSICAAEGVEPRSLDQCYLIDRANLNLRSDDEPWLLVEHPRTGKITKTEAFWRLADTIDATRPIALSLDNRARLFKVNQNDANAATMVISFLDALAVEFDMDVTLIGHPSMSGMSSGTGTSGSVGWSNAGRLRSYMHVDPENKKQTVFEMPKYSFGVQPDSIIFEWKDGRLYVEPLRAGSDIGKSDRVERVFLKLLNRTIAEKLDPTNNAAAVNRYAPTMFSKRRDREGINAREFESAMASLIEKEVIEVVEKRTKTRHEITILRPVGKGNL